eukprot:1158890-Pelagomonas_calceolata.AAC.3
MRGTTCTLCLGCWPLQAPGSRPDERAANDAASLECAVHVPTCRFDTVAVRFKRQLADLMSALQTMQPHPLQAPAGRPDECAAHDAAPLCTLHQAQRKQCAGPTGPAVRAPAAAVWGRDGGCAHQLCRCAHCPVHVCVRARACVRACVNLNRPQATSTAAVGVLYKFASDAFTAVFKGALGVSLLGVPLVPVPPPHVMQRHLVV